MDRKSIFILVICFVLLMVWPVLVNRIYPPKPLPPKSAQPIVITNLTPEMTQAERSPDTALTASTATASSPATNAPEELLEVTNAIAHYTFTSRGGGLKEVELLQYPETVASRREKKNIPNEVATLNRFSEVSGMSLLNATAIEGDGNYTLTRTGDGVRAEKITPNGLAIVKEFQLNTNFLVNATARLENRSKQRINLPAQQWAVGTATPMGPLDNGQAVGVLWFNGSGMEEVTAPWFTPRHFLFFPGEPRNPYHGGSNNVAWVAAHNQYFVLAAMPQQPAQQVVVRKVTLPRPTGEEARLVATNAPLPLGFEASMVYPALVLEPNQKVERSIRFYAGPKEYQTLVRIGNNLDQVMNFGTFGFVSKALLLGMNWMHEQLSLSYGWAIILITVIIKVVFWPLTQASTRSMKRMQALQPQMKAIQEKYKDDPVKMNRKTMEFMKEHKVSPLGGCLPMLLQIPVFFGFYRMIQSAIELRGESFLWVPDLSKSDTLAVVPGMGFVPFIGIPGVGLPINLLPLIMGATMLWQARLTPPSPGMDATQAKIMRYMPLMFMVFLYNFSAGLTLYWTVQNLLTIAQTKLTRTDPATPSPVPVNAPVLTTSQKKRK